MATPTQNGKRSREDFKTSYPRFVLAARKKFVMNLPESSATAESHPEHVIFFEPFLSYPMVVDGEVLVDPKHWATAFMKWDIGSIADVLCRAIFTQKDLEKRNAKGWQDGLPFVKKLAILRASKWMLNKNQDAWTFRPQTAVSEDEQNVVERVFDTFDSVYPQNSFETLPQTTNHNEASEMEISSSTIIDEIVDFDTMLATDPLLKEQFDAIMENLEADFEYTSVFNKVAKLRILGNAAQTARELTKISIPSNTDVFVDAVQFSKDRWAKATMKKDDVSTAEVLFRKYWKTASKSSSIQSIDDLCPVTRLAIIRAVAWMKTKGRDGICKPYSYDSAVPEHNMYLSPEGVKDIEDNVFRKYLGISSRTVDTGLAQAITPQPSVVVPSHNDVITQSTNQFAGINLQMEQPQPTSSLPQYSAPLEIPMHISSEETSNASSTTSSVPPVIYQILQTLHPLVIANLVVINDELAIPLDVWDEAFRNFSTSRKEPALQAGKFLFQKSFTTDEIKNQTYSGRDGTVKLNRMKTNGILESLSIMKVLADSRLSIFQIQVEGIPIQPMSEEEVQNLVRKIFTEHRRYLSKK